MENLHMRLLLSFKRFSALAAFGLYLLCAGSAQAGPIFTYDPGNSSVTLTPIGGVSVFGLPQAEVNQATDIVFELDSIGDSLDFDFISIQSGFPGAFVGSAQVDATLAFSTPSAVSGNGSATGVGFSLFGFLSGGSITWNSQPGDIMFSDGTVVNLAFGNDRQRLSRGGLNLTVAATTTLQAIPEPNMLALMGIGLVGAGVVSRRRRRIL